MSKATFHYVDMFTWRRITLWLRKRHKGINWKTLYRRFLTAKWDTPAEVPDQEADGGDRATPGRPAHRRAGAAAPAAGHAVAPGAGRCARRISASAR